LALPFLEKPIDALFPKLQLRPRKPLFGFHRFHKLERRSDCYTLVGFLAKAQVADEAHAVSRSPQGWQLEFFEFVGPAWKPDRSIICLRIHRHIAPGKPS
jgi:hypothetical protein